MEHDLQETENALRRLKPRAPSDECLARIARELDAKPAKKRIIFPILLSFGAASVAACLALVALTPDTPVMPAVLSPENPETIAASNSAPALPSIPFSESRRAGNAEIRRTLSVIEPLEIRRSGDGRFFRPYRVGYVETEQWPNAGESGNGATLIKSTPTEEVRFVPVDLI